KSDKRLRLCGLEYLTGLEGKTYDELERRYQRRIKETRVTVYLLEKGTPSEVKYNIFKRINKGSVPLSNQELRHALNPGKGTKFLAKLAASQEFQQVVQLSESRKKRMDDQEFILGFLAFRLTSYQDYQEGNRDSFLNDALFKANKLNEEELIAIEGVFYKAMIAALEIFGDQAFRKIYKTNKRKKPLNKSLFEAWSVNLSYLSDVQIEVLNNNKQKLINLLINYMNTDQEFLASISQAANKVKYRFITIEKIIKEVLS
ncbi:MAG: DUF262 domain-containing protein, partial [Symploca sp. SIO2D2]|nr:DUF262 domain-containing protein [Symploca sp. SIO2D2]